ncbi:MAG: DUF1015 domain-containing protein [Oscillospiraceae bacterium]|nr:DUF1015 domain-containing protein [Oscillospiraceae bacterium]
MSVFKSADILLPRNADMEKWAVIACDQFTSDPAYWQRVRQTAGESPSTIHLILPEAELGRTSEADTVKDINTAMERYLSEEVFTLYPNSFIYVERTLADGSVRPGLLGVVDLEEYDYHAGSTSAIRATEKTVLERIPPRQRVRKDAPIELPHVLMLCDDDGKTLIEPIAAIRDTLPMLYDFDLMEQGGHISGWLVQGQAAADFDARMTAFAETVDSKYADLNGSVLLAVGDGNHSLATAKSCYEALKAANPDADLSAHPARYSLVELENIHDPSLVFAPIHRIVMDVDGKKLLSDLNAVCAEGGYPVQWVMGEESGTVYLDKARAELAVAVLQEFLDGWLSENAGVIDYIHGDDEVKELARKERSVGFLLPAMEKHQLFRGVISGGALPRKTFSMGHAREKRYYLEGRKIR